MVIDDAVFQVFQMYVFKCFIWMLQKYIWMLHNMHVASICFKYFRCLTRMLQVFHLDVAKVDLDVA